MTVYVVLYEERDSPSEIVGVFHKETTAWDCARDCAAAVMTWEKVATFVARGDYLPEPADSRLWIEAFNKVHGFTCDGAYVVKEHEVQ